MQQAPRPLHVLRASIALEVLNPFAEFVRTRIPTCPLRATEPGSEQTIGRKGVLACRKAFSLLIEIIERMSGSRRIQIPSPAQSCVAKDLLSPLTERRLTLGSIEPCMKCPMTAIIGQSRKSSKNSLDRKRNRMAGRTLPALQRFAMMHFTRRPRGCWSRSATRSGDRRDPGAATDPAGRS